MVRWWIAPAQIPPGVSSSCANCATLNDVPVGGGEMRGAACSVARCADGGRDLVGVRSWDDLNRAQMLRRVRALLFRHQRELELTESLDLGERIEAADELTAQEHERHRVLLGLVR